MASASAYALVSQIATRQAGYVAAWQCRMAGVSVDWVLDRVGRHGWARVHRGVYRLGGVPPAPRGRLWAALLAVSDLHGPRRAVAVLGQGAGLVDAAVLAVHQVACVTGWSLAYVLGARSVPTAVPQVLVLPDVQVRGRMIRTVRSHFDPASTRTVDGLPCAPPQRMLYDAAWIGRRSPGIETSLHDLAVHLDRTRRFAVDDLLSLVEEPVLLGLPNRVPSALRRTAEVLRPGFSHSRTEAIAREAAHEVAASYGVELTTRPHPIRHRGRIIAEADIAAIDLRWDAEIDGPHHRALTVRRRDQVRDANLRAQVHWAVTRYDHQLVDDSITQFKARFAVDLQNRLAELPFA